MKATRTLAVLIGLCVLAAAGSADAATMLLRYNFDEGGSGATNALDSSGYAPAAPGTFIGSATRTSNTPGGGSLGALDQTTGDVNDDHVNGGDADKLDQLSAMTLTAWVNLQTVSSGTSVSSKRILSKWGPASTNNGWNWCFDSSTAGAATMRFGHFGTTRKANNATATVDAFEKWAFLAVTYDGADKVKFYEGDETNAVSQVGNNITGWGAITSGASTADFLVGDLSLTNSSTNFTLPGWMDDVRVYSGAATQSELEAVRQEGLIPEPASAVLLLLGLPLVIGRRRRSLSLPVPSLSRWSKGRRRRITMKGIRTIAMLLAVGVLLAGAGAARATLVIADYNDLSLGLQTGQFGGTGLSATDDWSGTSTIDVISGDLTAPAGTNYALTQSGPARSIRGTYSNTHNEGRQNTRDLALALTGDTVWFSFLVQNQGTKSHGGISFNTSSCYPANPRVETRGTSLYVNGTKVADGVFTEDVTALVLGRITVNDGDDNTWDIWVDPDVSGGESGLGATTATVDNSNYIDAAGITSLGNISHHEWGAAGDAIVDMVYLSGGPNGFADVTGVPEPASAVLLLLGLPLVIGRRRRRCR